MTEMSILNSQQWQFFKQENSAANFKNKVSSISKHQGLAKTESEELKKVCADFESLFVIQMMKDMRSAIPKDDLFHGGHAEDIYTSLLDEKYAKEIAANGSLGLGKQLYETLAKNLANSKNIDTKGHSGF